MPDAPTGTRGLTLGRLLGARVIVQPSTLVMVVILAFLISSGSGIESASRAFAIGALLAVLLFVSVFLHELAHALAARAFGRTVEEIVLTLWGGHTSFDARALTPVVSGVTALAGPVANLAIAGSLALVANAGLVTGLPQSVLVWVAWTNLFLGAFNALPGIPMDGGRVLESVVWGATGNRPRATIVAAWSGRVIAVLVLPASVAWPLINGRTPDIIDIVWGFVIFTVLFPAASQAIRVTKTLERRSRASAASLMRPAVGVPFSASVAHAYEAARSAGASVVVVLAADGQPAGHFPLQLAESVPDEQRAATSLQSVTMPLPRGAVMDAALSGDALVEAMRAWWGRTNAWAVVDGDRVVGLLELEHALKSLQ